jgi:16S rRNA G966 N2-methylase RsmD
MIKNQKDIVIDCLLQKDMATIKEVANLTNILEPNIRRILGQGEKVGVFERIAKGIYRIKNKDTEQLYLYHADSIKLLPKLAEEGLKVDAIFLDIPYDTPAIKGGNRGVKYELITVPQFKLLLNACKVILKNNDSKIVFMYSNATSGMKKMQEYIDCFDEFGLHCVADGSYTKLWAGGKVATNMRGDDIKPEGIKIFSQISEKLNIDFNYSLPRPNGYPTEKNHNMIADIIKKITQKSEIILDPFAGSGVVGIEALKLNVQSILIDNAENSINYIVSRINKYILETSQLSLF